MLSKSSPRLASAAKKWLLSGGAITWFLLAPGVRAATPDPEERLAGFFVDRYVLSSEVALFAPDREERVRAIVARIASANALPLKFQVRLLANPEANAYAGPGGYLYVTSGLLDLVKNDDELAGVIAHELAHVTRHHYFAQWHSDQRKERRAQRYVDITAFVVGLAIAWAVGPAHTESEVLVNWAERVAIKLPANAAIGAAGGVVLLSSMQGYRRDCELEADSLAVTYAERAGYEPRALISLFQAAGVHPRARAQFAAGTRLRVEAGQCQAGSRGAY